MLTYYILIDPDQKITILFQLVIESFSFLSSHLGNFWSHTSITLDYTGLNLSIELIFLNYPSFPSLFLCPGLLAVFFALFGSEMIEVPTLFLTGIQNVPEKLVAHVFVVLCCMAWEPCNKVSG